MADSNQTDGWFCSFYLDFYSAKRCFYWRNSCWAVTGIGISCISPGRVSWRSFLLGPFSWFLSFGCSLWLLGFEGSSFAGIFLGFCWSLCSRCGLGSCSTFVVGSDLQVQLWFYTVSTEAVLPLSVAYLRTSSTDSYSPDNSGNSTSYLDTDDYPSSVCDIFW